MIYLLGMEYLGLNGLFASVLSVLNLAELGIGMAMVYGMYKPIATNDKATLCALLKLYKVYYRFIGSAIGIVGLCLMPFIKYLIKGSVPADINRKGARADSVWEHRPHAAFPWYTRRARHLSNRSRLSPCTA